MIYTLGKKVLLIVFEKAIATRRIKNVFEPEIMDLVVVVVAAAAAKRNKEM